MSQARRGCWPAQTVVTVPSGRFRAAADVVYVLVSTTLESLDGTDPDGSAQPMIDALPEADVREALGATVGLLAAALIGLAGTAACDLLERMTVDAGPSSVPGKEVD